MDATTPTDADATPATDSAPDAPTAKAKTPTKRPSRAADDSLKETFESIVIAFILAFVFRAYVVEAFVIPTGSMAPTLLGQHMRVTCPACGYMFAVDPDNAFAKRVEYDEAGEPIGRSHREVICPMSGTRVPVPVDTLPSSGDRILVHKFIYSLVEPQRWDVVVFKNPANPDENYIKRLVGLPDEQLWIIEGNIYVKHADADDDAWQIARKSRRPKVQRSVFVPVYHSEYVPVGTRADGSTEQGWRPPWTGDTAHWDFATPRHYRMTTPGPATLSFDFGLGEDPLDQGQPPDKDRYTYNQIRGANRYRIEPVEDVRVAATFSPRQPGLAVTLTTTARTDDLANNRRGRRERIAAQISADGEVSLRSQAIGDDAPPPVLLAGPVDIGPFAADRPRRVELWLVDQEASVWIDGRRVLAHAFDLPIELVKTRPTLSSDYPEITIDCAGSPVTLTHVHVDRDLYYTQSSDEPRLGIWSKGDYYSRNDVDLGPDEFYCLGDNSPSSQDSRAWNYTDPWIHQRLFPHRDDPRGIVPRQLMMGRAFFVYFPAPLRVNRSGRAVIPNFGQMRFIH